MEAAYDVFKNVYVQMASLIIFATVHGYLGAWIAVRMLFRPRRPVRFLGLTIFPQGMIPRHRDRLAQAVGRAVGEELVSQETILNELTGKDFLRSKIQRVVDSYTDELLSQDLPSIIDALPAHLRNPVLDALSALQRMLAEYIEASLQSEESLASIDRFVTRRVDELLGSRVSDVFDDQAFEKIIGFLDTRVRSTVTAKAFEKTVSEFISKRLDELAGAETPVGDLLNPGAIELLKEKAKEQIEPTIHQLAEIATSPDTRNQMAALIKHEVHDFYENLPFFKKIFVSRENLLNEVDGIVNESLPRRIEETLRGEYFAERARAFIEDSIDQALTKPLPVLIGAIASEQLNRFKDQAVGTVLSVVRGEEFLNGISAYLTNTLGNLRPHSIDAILQVLHPSSEEKLKAMLSKGLLDVLKKAETANAINMLLSQQFERLLARPIGRIGDMMPEHKVREASGSLTNAIVSGVNAKLPEAIAEFDVAGLVREKIETYPPEKLEALVMSVAKEHLRTIELFGAVFGLFIGIAQAAQFYFYSK
jgi:uncharacterized membrane protein YheB (UPF0754 family)